MLGASSPIQAADRRQVALVDACQAMLDETAAQRHQRAEAMLNTVFSRSWDHTVAAVHGLLLQAQCQQADSALDAPAPMAAGAGSLEVVQSLPA